MSDKNHEFDYGHRRHRSFFFPILLIVAGFIFLLSNMGYLDGSGMDLILRLWPLIFIVGGLDDLLRGESVSGPVLGMGIGSLLLLANFGYFQWTVWEVLFRFWPVFLIAWGLDLIIGRRTTMQKLIGALVSIAIVAGIFWMVGVQPNFTAATNTTRVSQSLDSVKMAEVKIERPVGGIRVSGADIANTLVSGTVPADGFEKIETNYEVTNGRGYYELRSHGEVSGPIVFNAGQNGWNLTVSNQVPVALSVDSAVGESRLDLVSASVKEIDARMAVGRIEVSLPGGQAVEGVIRGAVGEVVIYVPRDARVRIEASTAVTAVNFPTGFKRDGNTITNTETGGKKADIDLRVNLPVGLVTVRYLP